MPESIDPKIFRKLYLEVLEDKTSNIENLYTYVKPFFNKLINEIENLNTNYYFILFLMKNISTSEKESKRIIQEWIKEDTIESDINYIFISRCRNIKKIPKKSKPKGCQYFFVTDLRLSISDFLKKKYRYKKIKINLLKSEEKKEYKIKNNWYNYLISMLSYGFTITEISNLTDLSRVTIYKECNKCQQLNKKQLEI